MTNTLKIYLAGSWEDRDEIKEIMDAINQHPRLEIITDWTRHEWGDKDHMRLCAREDKDGVRNCDVFVIHDPAKNSKGKLQELGMACAWGKPVITFKSAWTGIFAYLRPKLHARDADELVGKLLETGEHDE